MADSGNLHSIPLPALYRELGLEPGKEDMGLTKDQAKERLIEEGRNLIVPSTDENKLRKIFFNLMNYTTVFTFVFFLAVIIELLASGPFAILTTVGLLLYYILPQILSAINEVGMQDLFELNVVISVKVIRSGRQQQIKSDKVVRGDILILEPGMKVPADVRVIACYDIASDQSVFSGDPTEIKVDLDEVDEDIYKTKNVLLGGSIITNGGGKGVVIATGNNSILGKLAVLAEPSINPKVKKPSYVNVLSVVLLPYTILVISMRYLYGSSNFYILLLCGCIIITRTINNLKTGFSMIKYAKAIHFKRHKLLLTDVDSTEKLDAVDCLIVDPSGIFVSRDTSVVRSIWMGNSLIDAKHAKSHPLLQKVVHYSTLATKSVIEHNPLHKGEQRVIGPASEAPVIKFNEELISCVEVRDEVHMVEYFPHNQDRKITIAYVKEKDLKDEESMMIVFGPYDEVKNYSEFYLDENLTAKNLSNTENLLDKFHGQTQAIAFKIVKNRTWDVTTKMMEEDLALSNLCLLGVYCIDSKPLVDYDTFESILRETKIKLVIASHENRSKIENLCESINIKLQKDRYSGEDYSMISGEELNGYTEKELEKLVSHPKLIFYDLTPSQKFLVLRANQTLGFKVAYLGDDLSDSNPIKSSNLGVTSREAHHLCINSADAILIENDFETFLYNLRRAKLMYGIEEELEQNLLGVFYPYLILGYLVYHFNVTPHPILLLLLDIGNTSAGVFGFLLPSPRPTPAAMSWILSSLSACFSFYYCASSYGYTEDGFIIGSGNFILTLAATQLIYYTVLVSRGPEKNYHRITVLIGLSLRLGLMIVLLVVSYAIRKFKMMPGGMFDFLKSGVVMYAVVMGLLLTIRK
jgi:magnesium-transporting ATPase (P-type)